MPNRILTAGGWQQRIRDKLGIDVAYLPDAIIEQPENISVAEANIIKRVPDYANLEDDDRVYLEAAVVCECSALLCGSLSARLPAKQTGPSESHELSVDWNEIKKLLETERDNYLANLIPIPLLFCFGVSSPKRD